MNHTHNIFEGTIKEHQLQDRQDTYKFMAKRTCVSSAASNPFACIALTLRTVSPKQAGSVYAVKVLTVISLVRKKGSPAPVLATVRQGRQLHPTTNLPLL